jgi:hypothetical protein
VSGVSKPRLVGVVLLALVGVVSGCGGKAGSQITPKMARTVAAGYARALLVRKDCVGIQRFLVPHSTYDCSAVSFFPPNSVPVKNRVVYARHCPNLLSGGTVNTPCVSVLLVGHPPFTSQWSSGWMELFLRRVNNRVGVYSLLYGGGAGCTGCHDFERLWTLRERV